MIQIQLSLEQSQILLSELCDGVYLASFSLEPKTPKSYLEAYNKWKLGLPSNIWSTEPGEILKGATGNVAKDVAKEGAETGAETGARIVTNGVKKEGGKVTVKEGGKVTVKEGEKLVNKPNTQVAKPSNPSTGMEKNQSGSKSPTTIPENPTSEPPYKPPTNSSTTVTTAGSPPNTGGGYSGNRKPPNKPPTPPSNSDYLLGWGIGVGGGVGLTGATIYATRQDAANRERKGDKKESERIIDILERKAKEKAKEEAINRSIEAITVAANKKEDKRNNKQY
jgi:hypothetical protein